MPTLANTRVTPLQTLLSAKPAPTLLENARSFVCVPKGRTQPELVELAEPIRDVRDRDQVTMLSSALCLLVFCVCQLMNTFDLESVTAALSEWLQGFVNQTNTTYILEDVCNALCLWLNRCCRAKNYAELTRWIGLMDIPFYKNRTSVACHAFGLQFPHGQCNQQSQDMGILCAEHFADIVNTEPMAYEVPVGPEARPNTNVEPRQPLRRRSRRRRQPRE